MEERLLIPLLPTEQRALVLHEEKRKLCPFYGFHLSSIGDSSTLHDSEGNQCALKRSYSPCEMEVIGEEKPNWNYCLMNTRLISERLEAITILMRVFPRESTIPEGIPFGHWKDFVMNQE